MLTITGYEKYEFTSKDTNEPLSGYTFFGTFPINENRGLGVKFEKFSLSSDKVLTQLPVEPEELIGRQVQVLYNQYRKAEVVKLI